jgi:hypothetical protein
MSNPISKEKPMKKIVYMLSFALMFSSCEDFLEEHPTGFLTPSEYYTTPEQIRAAVNGTYAGLDDIMGSGGLEVATSPIYAVEYITGYSVRTRASTFEANQFLLLDDLDPQNSWLEPWWNATFYNLENCNSVIKNLSESEILDEETRNMYLGEVYFLRAYYYFQGVRIFGDIPLKTEPTSDLSDVQIPKSPVSVIYDQIVEDLLAAEQSGLPWTDVTGHVNMGAIKSLLANVYLTMAGYPLERGQEYYNLAYTKAKEVIDSDEFSLFTNYSELRNPTKENKGEFIFMLQREAETAGNRLHFDLMPYPAKSISISPNYGGALSPHPAFFDSYDDSDIRKQEQVFYYSKHTKYGSPNDTINLEGTFIYKFWDDLAEETNRSGANFSLIRYADLLLMCAEAKASADGGTTTDATAVNAYSQVRKRAFPDEPAAGSVSADDVLKERFWELSFEFKNWFDMLRTRKAFDVENGQIVNLIGYQAPNHPKTFEESNLLFPIPLRETRLNPRLLEPTVR